MAVLSITAGSVVAHSNVERELVTSGETITAGQLLYYEESTELYFKARANVLATAKIDGVALTGSSAGQDLSIATLNRYEPGNIDLGATLDLGMVYVLSPTVSGGIQPVTDLGTGHYVVVLGVAKQTNNLMLGVIDPQVQLTP